MGASHANQNSNALSASHDLPSGPGELIVGQFFMDEGIDRNIGCKPFHPFGFQLGKFLERPVVDFFLRKPGIFDIVRLRSSRYGSALIQSWITDFSAGVSFVALGHFVLGNALQEAYRHFQARWLAPHRLLPWSANLRSSPPSL